MAWYTSHRGSVYVPDQAQAGPSDRGVTLAEGSSQPFVRQRDLIDVNDVEKSYETTSQPSARSVPSAFESLNPFNKKTSAPTHPSLSSRGPDDYVARAGTGERTTDQFKGGALPDSLRFGQDSSSFNSLQIFVQRELQGVI